MSGWLDSDRPGSGPVEGDGRRVGGLFQLYRNGRWETQPDIVVGKPGRPIIEQALKGC